MAAAAQQSIPVRPPLGQVPADGLPHNRATSNKAFSTIATMHMAPGPSGIRGSVVYSTGLLYPEAWEDTCPSNNPRLLSPRAISTAERQGLLPTCAHRVDFLDGLWWDIYYLNGPVHCCPILPVSRACSRSTSSRLPFSYAHDIPSRTATETGFSNPLPASLGPILPERRYPVRRTALSGLLLHPLGDQQNPAV